MDDETRERYYREHIAREWADSDECPSNPTHPDGCFYCGGNHPSDCCTDREARDEYWEPTPK